jgi:energy-coupling factor transporter ATP-binding protein EcfA2
MRLKQFRVTNFRNINDSGWIDLSGTTALVGRNESGKTNLLHALRCISGPDAGEALSLTRDFPADRMRSEYSDDLDVIQTRWELTDEERGELAEILPQASQVSEVEVVRGYSPERRVLFTGQEEAEKPIERAKELAAQLVDVAQVEEGPLDARWPQALDHLQSVIARESGDLRTWTSEVGLAIRDLKEAGRLSSVAFQPEVREAIDAISELAAQTAEATGTEETGRQWVLDRLPHFLYLDEYPDIDGHMDLREFDQRRREGLTEMGDHHFETLLRMAGIDPDSLDEVLTGDPETRRQIVGRAGAGLTRKLRELWTDRPLKVRFNLDGDHFNTLVCDPTALCDIEVNLNQRSRGFRWFFSFLVMLSASRRDPAAEEAFLLLDEPGLHLHAAGQQDLLRHLMEHVSNESIIATQSPFMVPVGDAAAVRAVRFDEETGATVSDDPTGEELAAAPSIQLSRGERDEAASAEESRPAAEISVPGALVTALFGSRPLLVVEHLTDFWYLSAVAEHFAAGDEGGLPKDLVLMPAGGATLVPYLLGLLDEPPTNPILLLTSRPPEQTSTALSDAGLQQPKGIVFIGAGLPEAPTTPVEIEDLIEPDVYERFVHAAYRQKLDGKELEPDTSIACAVERYRKAFARLGLSFSRREPARLIARGSERNLRTLLSGQATERFERLLAEVSGRVESLRT